MTPTPAEVLAAIAAASPWYPAAHAQAEKIARDPLDAVVRSLWQAGLVEARDWAKGLGQGFGLTADGVRAAGDPVFLARALAGQSADAEPRERQRPPTVYDRGERTRRAYYNPRRPVVTQALVLLNVCLFILGAVVAWKDGGGRLSFLKGEDHLTLVRIGAVSGDLLLRGDAWRLMTANFVHIGFIHLLLNMYCLGMVGALAEDLWGRWRFLLVYLVAGLAGSGLAMILKPDTLVAGASGATWGTMASLAVWLVLYRRHFQASIMDDFAKRLLWAFIINGAISFWPRVSWQGHLGGAIGGAAMAFALDLIRPGFPRRTIVGIVLAVAIPAAIAGLLVQAVVKSAAWRPLVTREAVREQIEYLSPLQPEWNEISPPAVNTLLVSFQKTRGLPFRFGKVKEEAKLLLAKTDHLRDRLDALSAPPRLAREARAKARAYADAVTVLVQRLMEFLQADRDDLDAFAESRKTVEERWADLFRTAWGEP